MRELRALLFAGIAGLGCGSEPDPVRLEVFSWWQEEPERLAFESVINLHEQRHEDVEVVNLYRSDAEISRSDVTKRVLAGAPPSTFQANIGADLLRWAAVDTASNQLETHSRIFGLAELFEQTGLGEALPQELLEELRLGPNLEPFAVPINIHRVNVLYYNVAREEAYRASHKQQSFLELATLCPENLEPGAEPDVVIGAGTRAGFELILLAFENVLPALTSGAFYDDLFRGRASGDWALEVERALGCVQYLSRAFPDGYAGRTWADAVEEVRSERADFTVMGDWANGQLRDALASGAVKAVPFPGTEPIFVFTSDTFPLPIGAPHREHTRQFLATIASAEAQNRFSAEKGSMPARINVDAALLGPYESRAREFAGAQKLLATSGLFPPNYPVRDLGTSLAEMIVQGSGPEKISATLAFFRNAEPLLGRWQDRLATGHVVFAAAAREPTAASP